MKDMDRNDHDIFAGLYSSVILKVVVQALDIEDDVLQGRTASRFFSGESIQEHNRGQVFEALGQALIDRGIVPQYVDALPDGVSTAKAVGMAVGLVCERWDHLMSIIRSRGTALVDVGAVAACFIRLVAVDLSLRLFALTRLSGVPLPHSEPPLWAQNNGGGRVLRSHLRQAGLSRNQLAGRLGASYTSVDNWLDGKHMPNRAYVAALARELSPSRDELAIREFQQELNRQLTFAQ